MTAATKIAYYVVRERHGRRRAYWCPTPKMKAHGFQLISLGDDGPDARAEAASWTARWQAARASAAGRDENASKRPPSRDHGYVYFLRSGERVKIGFSQTPFTRVGELAIGMPQRPESVMAVKGTRLDELRLHRRLGAYRCAGEWFVAAEPVLRVMMRSFMFGRPMHDQDGVPRNKARQIVEQLDSNSVERLGSKPTG